MHPPPVRKIFISYRRSDSEWAAGRLRETLGRQFGNAQIFRDKENIQPGVDWRKEIQAALRAPSTVVLALIGPRWLSELDALGQPLIERHDDINRVELETTLQHRLPLIPVLIGETTIPRADQLPESLRELPTLNAVKLRDDDWESDVRRLITTLAGLGVVPITGGVAGAPPASPDRGRWALVGGVVIAALAILALLYASRGAQAPPTPAALTPAALTPTHTEAAAALPAPIENAPNIEIVVDRSDVMKQAFGQAPRAGDAAPTTKLDAARNGVNKALEHLSEGDNLALRIFGGECGPRGSSQQLLTFAPGKERVGQNVREIVKTFGQSTLVSAVTEATGDFNEPRFKGRRSSLIVITGGYDECGNPDPAVEIRRRLELYPDVKLDLRFIGVGLSPDAEARLGELAQALKAEITNTASPTELDSALQQILIVQPRVVEVETVTVTLNEGATRMNTAVSRIGARDYSEADRELQHAADALAEGTATLPNAQQPPAVRQLLDMARQRRDEQQRMLDAARQLVAASRSGDDAAAAVARRAYNAASARHNRIIGQINQLQEQIIAPPVPTGGTP
jgi:hypothetical protein